MKIKCNDKDITNHVESVTWGGSSYQASRTLDISILYSPLDKNISDTVIKLGDRVKLYDDDNNLLIDAMVYTRERASNNGVASYNCKDDMNRLIRSKATYNFKNTNPERITRKVCSDIGIDVGKLASANVPIPKLIADSNTIYTIIMKAYTKAFQSNSKKYMPLMVGRKLNVVEKGTIINGFVLSDKVNITDSNYSETIDNMVNKVKIYNDKGVQVGEVTNNDWIKSYGIFQDTYTKEDKVNSTTVANGMLKGIEKTADMSCIGNVELIAGYGVKIKDSITGLTGTFWIENDSHTWSNGTYTTELSLMFKNIMEIEEDDESETTSSGMKKTKKKTRKKTVRKKKESTNTEENRKQFYNAMKL